MVDARRRVRAGRVGMTAAAALSVMPSRDAKIFVPTVKARRQPRRSVSRKGRMGDLAIETQGDEVEDPDDFGVERGVPFTRKRAFYITQNCSKPNTKRYPRKKIMNDTIECSKIQKRNSTLANVKPQF